jgi:DNA topoisomerase-1
MGYTLIITEKPDAAMRIAQALDIKRQPTRNEINRVPYYTANRDKRIVVAPAIGHLYTVATTEKGRRSYPILSFQWQPRYLVEHNARSTRQWIENFTKLAQNADTFVDACDYDVEGSLIGYTILKYACDNKEAIAKRMKYSTLTAKELEKAYENLLPHLDFGLIEAGRTRHEVDWLFGINLTRALTTALGNHSSQYKTLSTGRVQGPTLKFLGLREKSIRSFVPTPYWTIRAKVEIDGQTFEVEYQKEKIETKLEANAILRACEGKDGSVEKISIKRFQQAPPPPFDLAALQNEAYNVFGYTPKQTLDLAQRLYVDALISYPRTCSQRLPSTIDYEMILRSLRMISEYRKLTSELLTRDRLTAKQGTKEDPAHPAIYPTGEKPSTTLSSMEKRVFDLIVRRFMAVFAEPATKESIKLVLVIGASHFYLRGTRLLKEGWSRFYGSYARLEDVVLPTVTKGQLAHFKKIWLDNEFTKPPPRYNPRSLLNRMEQARIGTESTRADIIQTMYNREYVKDERMKVTNLGLEILEILERYCPAVASTKLTREMEETMGRIRVNSEIRESVLAQTVETLKPIMRNLRENESAIGQLLSEVLRNSRLEERIIGPCPTCRTGQLVILRSRKSGKRFVGCTNYFNGSCNTSFPLPQRGSLRPSGRICHACGWPTVQVIAKGTRSWVACFNPQCPLKTKKRKRIEM